ncbi:MAG: aldolase/citrate lyase family protein [Thermomicrobiales bacterium]
MPKVNTAKRKMLAGEPAYGYALGMASPLAAEALAATGVDWILLDNQHGSFGPDSTIACLMAMAAGSAIPMARVARNDYTMIGRMLDEGALGIVVPMVHTPELAKQAADACRFPPVGTRSYGWGRAARYGDDYVDWINDELFLAIQLEDIDAVENAEAILSVPGVDGVWAGPSDLALSMGIDPRRMADDDRHNRALEKIVQACRNTGTIPGLACASPEEAKMRAAQGFQFVTAGGDMGFMMSAAMAGVKTLYGK